MLKPYKYRICIYLAILSVLPALLAACSSTPRNMPFSSQMPPAVNMDGLMVGNGNWMALYTYTEDTPTQSNCIDECAKEWIPLYATKQDKPRGDFSVIQRPNKKKQWALVGKPLYYWTHDTEVGQADGGEVSPQWKPFLVPDSNNQ